MEQIHRNKTVKDFYMPSSIVSANICKKSGLLATSECANAAGGSTVRMEYFAGSAPTRHCDCHISVQICSESQQLAGPYCPKESIVTKSFLVKDETGVTADTPYVISKDGSTRKCTVHNASTTAAPKEEDIQEESEDSNTKEEPNKNQTNSSSKPQSNNTITTIANTSVPATGSPR